MLRTKSTATTHSAITVVSAFATGKGVTIGTDIPCIASAELQPRGKGVSPLNVRTKVSDTHHLITTCAKIAMRYQGVQLPDEISVSILVDSKIPMGVGLKSSSAVSVAVTKAIFELFSHDSVRPSSLQEILRSSCEASIRSGASLTGAFDDAAACLLGGLVFSDNLKFKLLRHQELDGDYGTIVKILIPMKRKKLTSSVSLAMYRGYREQSLDAVRFARRGLIVQGMLLNSIIHSVIHHYSMKPVVSSIAEGASASGISGKGPAVAAICPNDKIARRIERRWIEENQTCRVISASITKPSPS